MTERQQLSACSITSTLLRNQKVHHRAHKTLPLHPTEFLPYLRDMRSNTVSLCSLSSRHDYRTRRFITVLTKLYHSNPFRTYAISEVTLCHCVPSYVPIIYVASLQNNCRPKPCSYINCTAWHSTLIHNSVLYVPSTILLRGTHVNVITHTHLNKTLPSLRRLVTKLTNNQHHYVQTRYFTQTGLAIWEVRAKITVRPSAQYAVTALQHTVVAAYR